MWCWQDRFLHSQISRVRFDQTLVDCDVYLMTTLYASLSGGAVSQKDRLVSRHEMCRQSLVSDIQTDLEATNGLE